jgi:TM2 domain-containing membrane protein YozV
MMMRLIFLLALFLAASGPLLAEGQSARIYYLDQQGDTVSSEEIMVSREELSLDERPNPVFKLFRKKQRLNKRITAAVLAFPFPFGIVGLHRIYLGTKPYVPVAYVASLGGVFGILPFIDFCAIVFDRKNFERYKDNGQVFMWLNH